MFLLLRGFLLTSSPLLFTLNLKSAFSRGFSFRKLQIFISQTTDFHFANYRQIFISQTTDFHFVSSHCVSCRFVSQTTESQIIRHDGGLKIANQPFAKQPSLHLSGLRDKFYIYRQVLYIVKSFIFFNKFYIFCNKF